MGFFIEATQYEWTQKKLVPINLSGIGPSFLGALIGALVFGMGGAILDIDKKYDISKMSNGSKPSVIRDIVYSKK